MRNSIWIAVAAVLFLALMGAPGRAQSSDTVFIEGARIITIAGEDLEKGAVLIQNGRIVALGADVEKPFDAKVIDATGKVIMPAWIDPMTAKGLDVANEGLPVVPFVDVADAIDPSDEYFESALRNGIATVHVSQGNNTVIGGVSRVVRPIGMTIAEMTIRPELGLKISIFPRRGFDHAGQMAALRGAFRDLDRHLDQLSERLWEEDRKEKGEPLTDAPAVARDKGRALITPEKIEERFRNLWLLREGKLEAFVYCDRAMDVPRARAFAKEQGFEENLTLLVGSETWKAADALKGLSRPVIIDRSDVIHRERDRITNEEVDTFVPGVFAKAKVPFAIGGLDEPWYDAARLVRNGLDRGQALRAITIDAARALALDHRLGTLEAGKDATLLILTGDPLDAMTWVDGVVIEGRLVYERAKDKRLHELTQGIWDTQESERRAAAAKAAAAPAPGVDVPPSDAEKSAGDAVPAPTPAAPPTGEGASSGAEDGGR